MNTFEFVRPATAAEAVAAAAVPGAAFHAGGTNLLDLMKGGIARPTRLVDVNRIPGLDRIEHGADGGVRIGSLVRNADLAHDTLFARRFPAVAEALLSGASAQLRNAATVGGNCPALRGAGHGLKLHVFPGYRVCCEIAGVWVIDGWEKCRMRREVALRGSLHPFRGSFCGFFHAADRVPV